MLVHTTNFSAVGKYKMKLSPRELESLLIHQTGFLAQKRLARGCKLNHPEAVALIACQVMYHFAFLYLIAHEEKIEQKTFYEICVPLARI